MTTTVKFELAKLLKEKGFKEGSRKGYLENGELGISHYSGLCWNDDEDYPTKYAAPTIAEVVMWLYEKHGIWISVSVNQKIERFISTVHENHLYKCSIYGQTNERPENGWETPTESYEAAIEYCLTNLI